MALAMFALLFTAFLPKLGVKFAWVTYHWIAGVVLTISVIYHLFPCNLLARFLVDLAGQNRPGGCCQAIPARPG